MTCGSNGWKSARLPLGLSFCSLLFIMGCDSSTDSRHALTISPKEVTLDLNEQSKRYQEFSVTDTTNPNPSNDVAAPIQWRVSDSSLGAIIRTTGITALYERTDKQGVNIISAINAYGDEGFATITQEAGTYTVSISGLASIAAGQSRATLTASGGVEPYEWFVQDSSAGVIISGGASPTAVYESRRPGDNVVHARDANGALGTHNIRQETIGSLNLSATPNPIEESDGWRSTITVSGGSPPYRWWVNDPAAGQIISGGSSSTAIYEAYRLGDNVIHVSDTYGVLGTLNITKQ